MKIKRGMPLVYLLLQVGVIGLLQGFSSFMKAMGNGIALSYCSDGFNPFHHNITQGTYSVWAQSGLILNLPQHLRTKISTTMVFGLISDAPTNITSTSTLAAPTNITSTTTTEASTNSTSTTTTEASTNSTSTTTSEPPKTTTSTTTQEPPTTTTSTTTTEPPTTTTSTTTTEQPTTTISTTTTEPPTTTTYTTTTEPPTTTTSTTTTEPPTTTTSTTTTEPPTTTTSTTTTEPPTTTTSTTTTEPPTTTTSTTTTEPPTTNTYTTTTEPPTTTASTTTTEPPTTTTSTTTTEPPTTTTYTTTTEPPTTTASTTTTEPPTTTTSTTTTEPPTTTTSTTTTEPPTTTTSTTTTEPPTTTTYTTTTEPPTTTTYTTTTEPPTTTTSTTTTEPPTTTTSTTTTEPPTTTTYTTTTEPPTTTTSTTTTEPPTTTTSTTTTEPPTTTTSTTTTEPPTTTTSTTIGIPENTTTAVPDISFDVTMHVNYSTAVNLTDTNSTSYQNLKASVEDQLNIKLNDTPGFKSLEVTSFRSGSLIIDFTTALTKTLNVVGNLILAFFAILSNKPFILINGENVTILTVGVRNSSGNINYVTTSTDTLCATFISLQSCLANETCQASNTSISCVNVHDHAPTNVTSTSTLAAPTSITSTTASEPPTTTTSTTTTEQPTNTTSTNTTEPPTTTTSTTTTELPTTTASTTTTEPPTNTTSTTTTEPPTTTTSTTTTEPPTNTTSTNTTEPPTTTTSTTTTEQPTNATSTNTTKPPTTTTSTTTTEQPTTITSTNTTEATTSTTYTTTGIPKNTTTAVPDISFDVTMHVNYSTAVNLTDTNSTGYQNLKASVQDQLNSKLNDTPGFKSLEVTSFRSGSLFIDFTTALTKTLNVVGNLILAFFAILSNKPFILINGENVTVLTVGVRNSSGNINYVTTSTDALCATFISLQSCLANETCQASNTLISCVNVHDHAPTNITSTTASEASTNSTSTTTTEASTNSTSTTTSEPPKTTTSTTTQEPPTTTISTTTTEPPTTTTSTTKTEPPTTTTSTTTTEAPTTTTSTTTTEAPTTTASTTTTEPPTTTTTTTEPLTTTTSTTTTEPLTTTTSTTTTEPATTTTSTTTTEPPTTTTSTTTTETPTTTTSTTTPEPPTTTISITTTEPPTTTTSTTTPEPPTTTTSTTTPEPPTTTTSTTTTEPPTTTTSTTTTEPPTTTTSTTTTEPPTTTTSTTTTEPPMTTTTTTTTEPPTTTTSTTTTEAPTTTISTTTTEPPTTTTSTTTPEPPTTTTSTTTTEAPTTTISTTTTEPPTTTISTTTTEPPTTTTSTTTPEPPTTTTSTTTTEPPTTTTSTTTPEPQTTTTSTTTTEAPTTTTYTTTTEPPTTTTSTTTTEPPTTTTSTTTTETPTTTTSTTTTEAPTTTTYTTTTEAPTTITSTTTTEAPTTTTYTTTSIPENATTAVPDISFDGTMQVNYSTAVNLTDTNSTSYQNLKASVQDQLNSKLNDTPGFKSLEVTSLRSGSLIIDFTTALTKTLNVVGNLILAFFAILSNKPFILINGENVTILTVGVRNSSGNTNYVTTSTDALCATFISLQSCLANETCQASNTLISCVNVHDQTGTTTTTTTESTTTTTTTEPTTTTTTTDPTTTTTTTEPTTTTTTTDPTTTTTTTEPTTTTTTTEPTTTTTTTEPTTTTTTIEPTTTTTTTEPTTTTTTTEPTTTTTTTEPTTTTTTTDPTTTTTTTKPTTTTTTTDPTTTTTTTEPTTTTTTTEPTTITTTTDPTTTTTEPTTTTTTTDPTTTTTTTESTTTTTTTEPTTTTTSPSTTESTTTTPPRPCETEVPCIPFGKDVGDQILDGDDVLSTAINTPSTMTIQGTFVNRLYLSTNGYLSINRPIIKYVISLDDDVDIIAPMGFDFDCSSSESNLYYQVYGSSTITASNSVRTNSVLKTIEELIQTFTENKEFEATWALVATWETAGIYGGSRDEGYSLPKFMSSFKKVIGRYEMLKTHFLTTLSYISVMFLVWPWAMMPVPIMIFRTVIAAVTPDAAGRDTYSPSTSSYFDFVGSMTLQCVIVTDGSNSFAIYNYKASTMTRYNFALPTIGFKMGNSVKRNLYSLTNQALRMHLQVGNVEKLGFYIYRLSFLGIALDPVATCIRWFMQELPRLSNYWNQLGNTLCPGSRSFANGLVRNPYPSHNFLDCYFIHVGVQGLECCYFNAILVMWPLDYKGTFVTATTESDESKYINENRFYRRQCCESGLCGLYHFARPSPFRYSTITRRRASFFFGDPHITTLDGMQYTFNGYGEYVLLMGNSTDGRSSAELQCRTILALDKENKTVNATIFGAFAGQDNTNSSFQVEMNSARNKLIIYGNKQDFSYRFNNEDDFAADVGTMKFKRSNDTLEIRLNSGVSLTFTLVQRSLKFSLEMPEQFQGRLRGLLGNFNERTDDDFILPNGTLLNTTIANYTEKEIFYGFGELWSLTNTGRQSLFQYPDGTTASDFSFPHFVPTFIEDFSLEAYNNASATCSKNGQRPDKSCIFDLLLTRDDDLALSSGASSQEADQRRSLLSNKVPSLSGKSKVTVTYNQTTTLVYNATDDGTVVIDVPIQPSSGFSVDNSTSNMIILTWKPTSFSPESIRVTVVDNHNVEGSPIDVEIHFCTTCSGNGNCSEETRNANTTSFNLLKCICTAGWTGDECDEDFNACAMLPCATGQNCTDLTPDQEQTFGFGYNCSDCPQGYFLANRKCNDINECNATNNCEQNCTNTPGSYVCSCNAGYRLQDSYKCNDINECIEGTSGCQQKCANGDGNYTCGCVYGYDLLPDGKTCNQTLDFCTLNMLTCSYACDNATGSFQCICQAGFKLHADGSNCNDIDECNGNICSQQCNNTIGSHQCSCYPGYKLNQDQTTCQACPNLKWGANCGNTCSCDEDGTARCDKATGCVCNAGYTGQSCNQDINECIVTPNICGSDKLCKNTAGSYYCYCPTGFKLDNGQCVDKNECEDISGHNCSSDVSECANVAGGFTCKCKNGYVQNGLFNCNDFNECEDGTTECEQKCINNIGSYSCACNFGFELADNRKTCIKINNICQSVGNLNCSYGCKIQNQTQASCYCSKGFVLGNDGQTCFNVNECNNATLNKCSQTCTDTEGGYTCSCSTGYKLNNDQRTCKACDQYHWGNNCANECNCGLGVKECNTISGCVCKSGWTGDKCDVDINECLQNPCPGSNEECLNSPGSYVCRCKTGYNNNTGSCQDTNECLDSSLSQCSQDCVNTQGSYTCTCKDGFVLTSATVCSDIDECSTGKSKCHQKCDNNIGNYICSCSDGFLLNATDKQSCYEKTKCSGNNTCSDICFINSTGHEECKCPKGYKIVGGINCTNIDECLTSPCSQICFDATPGYTCSCKDGFYLQGDSVTCKECSEGTYGSNCNNTCGCIRGNTKSCNAVNGTCTCNAGWKGGNCEIDIDECTTGVAVCQNYSTCRNTNGSYVCDCEAGYVATSSSTCTPCSSTQYGQNCAELCACVLENTVECNKVNGSCMCKQGWNGTSCSEDINECNSNPCSTNQDCTNTNGSYTCNCKTGYVLNSTSGLCIDLDECLVDSNNNCDVNADCENTVGGYNCTCKTGFEGDGLTCRLITTTTQSTTALTTTEEERTTATDTTASFTATTETVTLTVTTTKAATQTSTTTQLVTETATTTQETTETSTSTKQPTQTTTTTQATTQSTTTTPETTQSTTTTPDTTQSTTSQAVTKTTTTRSTISQPNTTTTSAAPSTTATVTTETTTATAAATRSFNNSFTFDYNPVADISNTNSQAYQDLLAIIIAELEAIYRSVRGFISVIITRMIPGSLIVSHTVRVQDSTSVNTDITTIIKNVIAGNTAVSINGTNTTVIGAKITDTNGNIITVTASTTLCQLFIIINPCDEDETCDIVDSKPLCVKIDEPFTWIAVGISIPIGIAAIATGVILFVYLRRRRLRLADLSESESQAGQDASFANPIKPRYYSWGRTTDGQKAYYSDFEYQPQKYGNFSWDMIFDGKQFKIPRAHLSK